MKVYATRGTAHNLKWRHSELGSKVNNCYGKAAGYIKIEKERRKKWVFVNL